ncbi:hypothetical protein EV426DRAFT_346133 [Tirmania nivea]|nr:hypothetical protein EV426DRAFT_346133 [Tirmania nivea]
MFHELSIGGLLLVVRGEWQCVCKYPETCTYVYQEICDTSITQVQLRPLKILQNICLGMVHPNSVLRANARTAVRYWILHLGKPEKMDEPVQMVACICYQRFNCEYLAPEP